MKTVTAADYSGIEAWGRVLGSRSWFIDGEQKLALSEGAPLNAIYKDRTGHWVTIDEVADESLRNRLENY